MSLEQVARVRAMIAARPAGLSLAERRAGFEAMMARDAPPADVAITPAMLGDVPVLRCVVPGGDPARALLWFHGGQFAVGSAAAYRSFGARVAAAAGCAVLLADQRLAPEHPYPAPLDDAASALDAALDLLGPAGLAVGGDSSGAALAVGAVQRRLAEGESVPAAAWLLSPYLDFRHISPSIAARAPRDPFVDPAQMDAIVRRYLDEADAAAASPALGPVAGFPRTLVQVGSDEALFDDAWEFAARLREAGGAPVFQEWAGMIHVWPLFAGQIDEGCWAIAQAGAFLREALA